MAYVRLNIVLNDYFAEDDLSDLMKERGWQSAGGRVTGKGDHDVDFLKEGEPMSDVALTGLLLELRADPNYLLFRGCGMLRGLDDGWRRAFFVPGIVSAAGDEISMSVNISSKARSAGPGGALARSWSP
jgi:hypothetical protein